MIMRDGIRMRLGSDPSIEVIGEAADGVEALQQISDLRPDIALIDLRMPGLDGFELASRVVETGLDTRVIIYSGLASPHLIEQGFEAGIAGYVGKESHRDVLFMAIDTVLRGERFVDPTIAARMIGASEVTLTTREREVLELMGDGMANNAIAERLGLAPETVRHHVSGVLRKLEVTSRTEAVATALRNALIF